MRTHNLLAVDFDSFFPNPWGDPDPDPQTRSRLDLWDWGHADTPFHVEVAWSGRAQIFLANDVPLPDLDNRQLGFWDRFHIAPGARLYYADSNAMAASTTLIHPRSASWGQVWLYDAHHDSGYNHDGRTTARTLVARGEWTCEDWMVLYRALGARLHMRYPPWKAWALQDESLPLVPVERAVDDGSAPEVVFDRIFVCRSGGWVPPWLDIDARFEAFVAAAPVRWRQDLQPGGTHIRHWDQAVVEEFARKLVETFGRRP